MSEMTVGDAIDDRFISRMGRMIAEAEKRAVSLEIERDFWQQRDIAAQQRITELEQHVESMHDSGEKGTDGPAE